MVSRRPSSVKNHFCHRLKIQRLSSSPMPYTFFLQVKSFDYFNQCKQDGHTGESKKESQISTGSRQKAVSVKD